MGSFLLKSRTTGQQLCVSAAHSVKDEAEFDAFVTGDSEKGTWVRLLTVPVEGKLMQGFEGLDVGDRIRVVLTAVDVQHGFIDFKSED